MAIETIDSKKTYKAPLAKAIEVNTLRLLCISDTDGTPRYGEEELDPDIFG